MLVMDRIRYNFKFGTTTVPRQGNFQRFYPHGHQQPQSQAQTINYWASQGSPSPQFSERSEYSSPPSSPWYQQASPSPRSDFNQMNAPGCSNNGHECQSNY